MNQTSLFALIFFSLSFNATGQYKYGLTPSGYNDYLESVRLNPENELIDLKKHIPDVVLDIRYATTNNFTGQRIYDLARAYARKPVAEALKKIQTELKKKGLGIKIF